MKKQLLLLILALGAALPVPMLAKRYTQENYACEESLSYYDMPALEDCDSETKDLSTEYTGPTVARTSYSMIPESFNTDLFYDEENEGEESDDDSMPTLREVGTIDNTLSWTTPKGGLLIHSSYGIPKIATSCLAGALYLAIATKKGVISIVDMETGMLLSSSKLKQKFPIKYIAFSPEAPHRLTIAGEDRSLKTIDIRTGNTTQEFITQYNYCDTLAFDTLCSTGISDDGKKITSDPFPAKNISFSADGSLLMGELCQQRREDYQTPLYGLWDTKTGAFIGKYSDITFFSDGEVLANGSRYGYLQASGAEKPDSYRYAISAHSKKMAIVKGNIPYLYDLKDGKIVSEKMLETSPKRLHNSSISFSHDGTRLAVSGWCGNNNSMIEIWNTETGNKIYAITEPSDYVHNIHFSPNNQQVLYCIGHEHGHEIKFENLD